MDKVRVDKWLWSVRIYKSRSLATKACKDGDILIGEQRVKPSQTIEIGDQIQVKKNGFDMTFKVEKLIQKRVGAPIAVECYKDLTPKEEYNKYESWFQRSKPVEFRERGSGRPTKRERRELDKFKGE
ncbi:MAG: RNA-binding S4 domain-containing protein [Saprospirales bacterium]|nr:MAG: RNA-binding S4 domain-containing protein [Saprospirales bacterium]